MSSKRKHNHNATAEVDYLENKTNNETDKSCFNAYLLDFFRFSSSWAISFDNVAMLALNCSLLRFKPFTLITYDRSDFSADKRMHSNASSSIMAITFSNYFTFAFILSMSFERCGSCLSVSLLPFFCFSDSSWSWYFGCELFKALIIGSVISMVYGFNLWKSIWSFIRRFDMTDSALIFVWTTVLSWLKPRSTEVWTWLKVRTIFKTSATSLYFWT